jgi:hypothetical protein
VLGGLVEFGSMVIGLRHLVAVAAVLYLLAAWVALRRAVTLPARPLPSAT